MTDLNPEELIIDERIKQEEEKLEKLQNLYDTLE